MAGHHGDHQLTHYSIRKLGDEYVVLADDQSILKFTSRRKAAKLILEASELLSVQFNVGANGAGARSISREERQVP